MRANSVSERIQQAILAEKHKEIARRRQEERESVKVEPSAPIPAGTSLLTLAPGLPQMPGKKTNNTSQPGTGEPAKLTSAEIKSRMDAREAQWQKGVPADIQAEGDRLYKSRYDDLISRGVDSLIAETEAGKARQDYFLDASSSRGQEKAKMAGEYYNAKVEEAEAALAANSKAAQAFEDLYRLDDLTTAAMGILAIAERGGAPISEWQSAADTVSDVLGLTVEGAGGFDQYAQQLREFMHTGIDTRRAADEQAVVDAGLDLELLKEARERQSKAEQAQARREVIEQETKKDPFGMNAVSVLLSPLLGVEYVSQLLGNIGHNDTSQLESYRPLDVNDMPLTDSVAQVRGETAENINNKVLAFLYNNGMSIADSTAQIAALGPASVFLMGGSAAASQMKDVLERGGTNRQAMLSGAAAGAAEMLFEKVSIDKLLAQKSVTGWVSWLAETAKQAGVEASEETFTEVANILSDAAIMGDNSDFARNVENYTAQGYAQIEAKKKAFLDSVGQVALAAAGGALSGGVMGGAVNAVNGVQQAKTAPANRLMEIYDEIQAQKGEAASPAVEGTGIPTALAREIRNAGPAIFDSITPAEASQTAQDAPETPVGVQVIEDVLDGRTRPTGSTAQSQAELSGEGQKNSAPEGGKNIRMTNADESEYIQTGNRPQVIAVKQAAVNSGEKIVLTSQEETRNYIHGAISGETKGVIPKAYGKVGSSMANDVYAKSNGTFDVEGWYLELIPSDLRHAFLQHSDAKQNGNIPLEEKDFLNIPDYIDTYDDILECKTFSNGEREIVLGKKINGYSVIVEIVSKSRKSLSFKNMWGVDTPTYEAKYKNNTEYRPSRSSEIANGSTRTHNDAVLNSTVPQSTPAVNPQFEEQGTPATGSEGIPAAQVGSTGTGDLSGRSSEDSLSRGQQFVKDFVDEMLDRGKDRRASMDEVLRKITEYADTHPEDARGLAEGYRALTSGGEYAVDAGGKLYKTGGETDLSIAERQEDLYGLGSRKINALQYDHPEVHRFFVEAAQMLQADIDQTTRGERIFTWRGDDVFPTVTGVKRNTSGPIAALRDDYKMSYPRIEDVLERIINDKGQENIADAKRVEMLLDDILRNGYESLSGPIPPNAEYIETLRRMGQIDGEEYSGLMSREDPGQRRGEEGAAGFRNIGAAERGFATPTQGTMAPTQNKTATQGIGLTEADRAAYAPEKHETVPAQKSLEQAGGLFYQDEDGNAVNVEDTVDALLEKDAWTGVEQDAAQIAFRWMNAHKDSLTDEQYSRFWALHRAIEEIGGTEAGRSLQARQKWVESGDGIVSKSMSLMDDPRINREAARRVIKHVQDLAKKYDRAVADKNNIAFAEIVRECAVERNTTKVRENGQIKKTAEWAIQQILQHGDVDFMRQAARSSIIAMAQDYVPQSATAKLKAVRRDAMLSKISTWARNVVSNNVFDPIDSIARDISVPLDMLLSNFTHTRSVNWDASWFSKAKREGTKYGLARSFLEVSLDISAEGAESKYGQAGNRTFRMSGGIFSRFMSQWEKISNYAMYSTDQMQKGGIEAEIQRGIDKLYDAGKIADDSLRDAGEQEATYRTFQEESGLSQGLSAIRQGLNCMAHVGDMGLGDVLMPFVQVPANLVDITVDYSPVGMARGLMRLTDTLIDAKNGTMTAAQQARAVQTIGRSLTGTGVLALAVLAKMSGALLISDDGRDEDKDKAALESQANLSGTQINLSGIMRLFKGGSAEKQSGDVLMSIGFLDPLNALLNMGGLIADDYVAEHEGEENGITFGEVVQDAAAGITQSVMDLPMMSPIADAAQAYQYSKGPATETTGLTSTMSISTATRRQSR